MNYNEAYEKLEQAGQLHVLKYYEELSEEEKRGLLEQIDLTDFSVLSSIKEKKGGAEKGEISPIGAMELSEISENREEFKRVGTKAIQDGKVGAVLLAGGMGTRLGSDDPKGMYNIGVTKDVYIFERIITNLLSVVKEISAWVHLFIMTIFT